MAVKKAAIRQQSLMSGVCKIVNDMFRNRCSKGENNYLYIPYNDKFFLKWTIKIPKVSNPKFHYHTIILI